MKMIADAISDNDFSSLEHLLSPEVTPNRNRYYQAGQVDKNLKLYNCYIYIMDY